MPTPEPAPTPPTAHRLRRVLGGIRVRSALAATAVVAAALIVASAALLVLLQRSLIGAAQTSASTRARDVAVLVADEGEQDLGTTLRARALPGEIVQVLGADDAVVATSTAAGRGPLADVRPAPGQSVAVGTGRLRALDFDEPYVLAARGVSHGGEAYVVIAAIDVDSREEAVAIVGLYLLGGVPVLLTVVGGATYLFVGRTLRPVEAIRRRVAGIGGRHLGARVPVPPSHDEVARLAHTMNAMLGRVQVAHETQRRFVADASHELRSPLATMRVGLEVADAGHPPTHWPELHASLTAECRRMSTLVEDLLLLARADEDGIGLCRTDVDLDDLLGAEALRLRATTTLRVDTRIAPVRVRGDGTRLAQVLRNLVDNAAQHAHSRLEIGVRELAGAAEVEIRDDGPGIPAVDRKRVFDRFVRLDDSRDRARGGSGLGLAIVREIVAAHRGTVRACAAPGGGALFRVVLPLGGQVTADEPRDQAREG